MVRSWDDGEAGPVGFLGRFCRAHATRQAQRNLHLKPATSKPKVFKPESRVYEVCGLRIGVVPNWHLRFHCSAEVCCIKDPRSLNSRRLHPKPTGTQPLFVLRMFA